MLLILLVVPAANAQWTQFGGPGQEFRVGDPGIAEQWPDAGPVKLWKRKLGEGYSAILADNSLADGSRLYTMYRAGDEEVVICLAAETGKTLWEYRYVSLPPEKFDASWGRGPNATPLLTGGRLYSIGVAGVMQSLEAESGKPLWTHDLFKEFGATALELGYSSSPIEYEQNIIVLAGGKDQSIIAFDKESGKVAWKALTFENSYSTPRILRVCGADQLVAFMGSEAIGANPRNGTLLWRYPIVNEYKQNITMPVLLDDDLLFITTWREGARGLKLTRTSSDILSRAAGFSPRGFPGSEPVSVSNGPLHEEGNRSGGEPFQVEEAWSERKVQSFYGNAVRFGDYVYGSSGAPEANLMCAVNARTGKLAWRLRGYASTQAVGVGTHLLILDEDGYLTLATPNPTGLTVHAKARPLKRPARTVPTVVGSIVYLRDWESIMALELVGQVADLPRPSPRSDK